MWPTNGRSKAALLLTACATVAVVWVLKGKGFSTAPRMSRDDESAHDRLKHVISEGTKTATKNKQKDRPLKECPQPSANSDNMCRDKTKIMIYSKLYDGFPRDRFRGYQKVTKSCMLPNGVQCVYTEDDELYRSADVLYVHDCFSYCQLPA